MEENRNMYGGHDISGYVPPKSATTTLKNTDQSLALNMEYLEKVSSILDRMEKMETFVAHDDERRRIYEEQRTADINALRVVARDIMEVKNKIWEAGDNTEDMLKEISELKNLGIDLTTSAKETIQNAGDSIRKKMEEYMEGDFIRQMNTHMNGLENKVKAIETAHGQALGTLKHEYEKSISTLEIKQGKLFSNR